LGTGSVKRRVATALPREHLPLDLARQVIEILLEANGVDIPQLHVRAEEPDRVLKLLRELLQPPHAGVRLACPVDQVVDEVAQPRQVDGPGRTARSAAGLPVLPAARGMTLPIRRSVNPDRHRTSSGGGQKRASAGVAFGTRDWYPPPYNDNGHTAE
jgi:hypothetical protein